jgi:hypothetical protein
MFERWVKNVGFSNEKFNRKISPRREFHPTESVLNPRPTAYKAVALARLSYRGL